jgi:hypothetical protein
MTILGCATCGKMEEGMEIVLNKGIPTCKDCFDKANPPANVFCSFRCGRTVSDPTQLAKRQPLCQECASKQSETVKELHEHINRAKVIDESVQMRTDIFNLKTTAIIELKNSIDSNIEIENKPYTLAETLKNRFEHLKARAFQINEELVDVNNEQRAIQTYLNNMSNTLRAEEREKLRIADINYKPNPVKPSVSKIRTVGTAKAKKATNKEIADAAKLLGIAEFTLKSFVLMAGGDLTEAVKKIQTSIQAAKSQ